MSKLTKTIIGLAIGGTVAYGATIIPLVSQEMKWIKSYETVQFETIDGDLGTNEYASKDNDEWYIRISPKKNTQFTTTDNLDDIKNKTQVAILCEKCFYYSEFLSSKNEVVRVPMNKTDYDGLRYVKNFIQPKKTELISLGSKLAEASIAFDNVTSTPTAGVSSVSFSHTATGSDLVLYSGVMIDGNVDATSVICSYNSVSMTSVGTVAGSGNNQPSDVFRLVNPSTGSQTLACSWSGGGTSSVVVAISYTGVNQTTPEDTAVTSGGLVTSTSDNITSETGDVVLDFMNVNGQLSLAQGGGQTERSDTQVGGAGGTDGGTSEEAGATTVTMSWSWDGTSQRVAHIVLNLNVASAGGGGSSGDSGIIFFE